MVQVRGGVEEEEPYMWMMEAGGEGKRGERKRRFSEEQVKSLESMFESQTKLEPRKKLQLAEELGLHPRQVAIWFQNKRARWKSKQLEREYDTLRADYDALLSSFESLKSEKQLLTNQLEKLAEMLEKPAEGGRRKDIGPGNGGGEEERTPSLSSNDKSEARIVGCSDDEEKMCAEVGGDPVLDGSSLVSAEQQFGFQPSWPSEQPCSGSQWWEFWPMNE